MYGLITFSFSLPSDHIINDPRNYTSVNKCVKVHIIINRAHLHRLKIR